MRVARPRVVAYLIAHSILCLTCGVKSLAQVPEADSRVLEASDEGKDAIARFQVPRGFRVELVAAEPLLANPVAFTLDEKGRIYVAETFRLHQGVTDNRSHMYWVDDDLAARTVADRVAMYRKHLGMEAERLGMAEDRVRRLTDRDGDGVFDESTVFAGGFRDLSEGLGSGVLARGNEVWYSNIPNLWKLVDRGDDGVADEREALSTGYGVHVAFLGHDLHGLIFGPDGRIYFTVGDRGLNVTTREGTQLTVLARGAVLRCEPDGSNLEVFATGLRNPQELAFDPYGNLFTVDNNSDGGDRARLVDLVPGGDSGWRMGYQYMESPASRGPWNAERLWMPRAEGNEAAYMLAPLANLADGPAGLTRASGTGLPKPYQDQFFLADFRGSAGSSGIRSFSLLPRGASFEIAEESRFLWAVLATDVELAPGGGLLISDWTDGWDLTGKGRIYRLRPTEGIDEAESAGVVRLLAEGMTRRGEDDLGALLAHGDYRVRQAAQFELAARIADPRSRPARQSSALDALIFASRQVASQFARLHAVWGLGQVTRVERQALTVVVERLKDPDPQVRAQAARVVGESGRGDLAGHIVELLDDPMPRTRMEAAIALGRLKNPLAVEPLRELLRANDDEDAYLRHGAVMGLVGTADPLALERLSLDDSPAVRLGALLAFRRLGDPKSARFLVDPDPLIALEAARAIADEGIDAAMASLAELDPSPARGEPVLHRILAANERLGTPASARNLAAMASRADLPDRIRVEAIDALGSWSQSRGRDRVVGLWRPIAARSATDAAEAVRPRMEAILKAGPSELKAASVRTAGQLGLREWSAQISTVVGDADEDAEVRIMALRALRAMDADEFPDAVTTSVSSRDERLRSEGLGMLASLDPARALPVLSEVLDDGSMREQQAALTTLGRIEGREAESLLLAWLDRLNEGKVPVALRLDLIESAAGRGGDAVAARLKEYEAGRVADSPLAAYRESLEGGDAERGRRILLERTEAQCLKCHKLNGQGGEVGPELSGIGGRKERAYLLRSIVEPDAEIAQGYETLVVATSDGRVVSGIVKLEEGEVIRLIGADGKLTEIPKADIEERKRGVSAMPKDLLEKLSRRDVRDLVAFLSDLK